MLAPAMNDEDILRNKAAGKISSVLTVEDGVPLDGKMERLEEFYQKGVRLISYTWNSPRTAWATPTPKTRLSWKKG